MEFEVTGFKYIFTQVERKLIDHYLETGIKVQDFYVLLNRIVANYSRLKEDFELLGKVLENEKNVI